MSQQAEIVINEVPPVDSEELHLKLSAESTNLRGSRKKARGPRHSPLSLSPRGSPIASPRTSDAPLPTHLLQKTQSGKFLEPLAASNVVSRRKSRLAWANVSPAKSNGPALMLALEEDEVRKLVDFFDPLGLPLAEHFSSEAIDLDTMLEWKNPREMLDKVGIHQFGVKNRIIEALKDLKLQNEGAAATAASLGVDASRDVRSVRGRFLSTNPVPDSELIPKDVSRIEFCLAIFRGRIILPPSLLGWGFLAGSPNLYIRCDSRASDEEGKETARICRFRTRIVSSLNPVWREKDHLPTGELKVPENWHVHIEVWDDSALAGLTHVGECVWDWNRCEWLSNGIQWVPMRLEGEFSGEVQVEVTNINKPDKVFRWEDDKLGYGYEKLVLNCSRDTEGAVVCTLVRRLTDADTATAVLYLPSFSDYFWQKHIGEGFNDEGYNFYALDYRKCGRSLLGHQHPFFVKHIEEYYEDIHLALEVLRRVEDNVKVLLVGQGFGGLLASLFAHDHPEGIDGVCLLSPYFSPVRNFSIKRRSSWLPTGLGSAPNPFAGQSGVCTLYHHSLHSDHKGEWKWDTKMKPMGGHPLYSCWLEMLRKATARVENGLALQVPVLVLCAQNEVSGSRTTAAFLKADSLLSLEKVVSVAGNLGHTVKIKQIPNALHDLLLSPEESARDEATDSIYEYFVWLVDDEFESPAAAKLREMDAFGEEEDEEEEEGEEEVRHEGATSSKEDVSSSSASSISTSTLSAGSADIPMFAETKDNSIVESAAETLNETNGGKKVDEIEGDVAEDSTKTIDQDDPIDDPIEDGEEGEKKVDEEEGETKEDEEEGEKGE